MEKKDEMEEVGDNVFVFFDINLEDIACQKNQF